MKEKFSVQVSDGDPNKVIESIINRVTECKGTT